MRKDPRILMLGGALFLFAALVGKGGMVFAALGLCAMAIGAIKCKKFKESGHAR